MTDTQNNPITATGNSAPSPDAVATFTARAKAAGLSDDVINRTLAANRVGTVDPNASVPAPARIGHNSALSLSKVPTLNVHETEQAIAQLRQHWTGDAAVLEAAIAHAEGKVASGELAAEQRNAFEQAYDRHLAAPDNASEYRLDAAYSDRATENVSLDNFAALDSSFKSMLHDMGTPVAAAPGIVSALLEGQDAFDTASKENTDPASLALWRQGEKVALESHAKQFGGGEVALQYAAWALGKADPEFVELLRERGSLDDHRAVVQLAAQGQRLFLRELAADARRAKR